jgi:hypothetical protein
MNTALLNRSDLSNRSKNLTGVGTP